MKNQKFYNGIQIELEQLKLKRINAEWAQLKGNSNNADTSNDCECEIESAESIDSCIIKRVRTLTIRVPSK